MHPAPAPFQQRLQAWARALGEGLIEREDAVRVLLLAGMAGEHVLLIGPPGTAKSELARRLHRAFAAGPYVERLLTRFSTPDELFGPLSLQALEQDRYERQTRGHLPEAGIAFLDEVFRASSAILNALLTLLNERAFDNGGRRHSVPLLCLVGATNDLPTEDGLEAFRDRFLLQWHVAPVSEGAFAQLLGFQPASPMEGSDLLPLMAAERNAVRERAAGVALAPDGQAAARALRQWVAEAGLVISDRRWHRALQLLRVAAAIDGRNTVDALDLATAAAWVPASGAQTQALQAWLGARLLGAEQDPAEGLTRAVEAFEAQATLEQRLAREGGAAVEAASDGAAGKQARLEAARNPGEEDAGTGDALSALRMPVRGAAPAADPTGNAALPAARRAARLAQCTTLDKHLAAAEARHHGRANALQDALRTRFWPGPQQAAQWLSLLRGNAARVQALRQRLAEARAVFAALPVAGAVGDRMAASATAATSIEAPLPAPGDDALQSVLDALGLQPADDAASRAQGRGVAGTDGDANAAGDPAALDVLWPPARSPHLETAAVRERPAAPALTPPPGPR